jgi:hypothetical protein
MPRDASGHESRQGRHMKVAKPSSKSAVGLASHRHHSGRSDSSHSAQRSDELSQDEPRDAWFGAEVRFPLLGSLLQRRSQA